MSRISRQVEIAAPVSAVWPLLEDVRRLPEFSERTLAVTDAPERITAVGESYTQVGKVLGREYRSRWTVTELEVGSLIRSEGSIGGGVSYSLTQLLEPLGDTRCRLRVDMDYALPGGALGRIAGRAGIERQAAREAQAVLDGIRAAVESA